MLTKDISNVKVTNAITDGQLTACSQQPQLNRNMLTEADHTRYKRQIALPSLGVNGQNKLKESVVIVAGLGGLGSTIALQLTCAGVGEIILIDSETVELSNLNRQVLYSEQDLGTEKSFAAARRLTKLNSSIRIRPLVEQITRDNAKRIIKGAHAVMDGMDSLESRFILNSACQAANIPFIHGGVSGLFGEITTIVPGKTPCLACIYPNVIVRPRVTHTFGMIPALVGALQVAEAIKLLTGFGQLLTGKMLYVNVETMGFKCIDIAIRPGCSACGGGKDEHKDTYASDLDRLY